MYEINISLNGKHFFATAKRSINDKQELNEVLLVFIMKFPKDEGYEISISEHPQISYGIDIKDIIN